MFALLIKILITVLFLVFGYGVLLTMKEWRRSEGYRMSLYVFESLVLMPFSYAVYFRLRKNNAMRRNDVNSGNEAERCKTLYKTSVIVGIIAYLMLAGAIFAWSITE